MLVFLGFLLWLAAMAAALVIRPGAVVFGLLIVALFFIFAFAQTGQNDGPNR